ncbi:unnamed protein product [Taenia asiatica]|uniref:Rho family GTPase n=1 Tax=Taenia asiatica TaxID=60517 RepID=A0A0R3WGT4_TAEAS|nr:unnamed protein product [Taenia asiatica]
MSIPYIKCVLVGDDAVGKTCLLIKKACGEFHQSYIPRNYDDHYSMLVDVQKAKYELRLIETHDQEIDKILRKLIYPGTSVFMLCFAVDQRSSFDSVAEKWVPHIKEMCPVVPILLVGCQIDVRTSSSVSSTTYSEGEALARKIGAVAYMECSACDNTGVDAVFDRAAQIAAGTKTKKLCSVMGNETCPAVVPRDVRAQRHYEPA